MNANDIIERLELEPLPGEGGWFRETYRAPGIIPVSALPGHDGNRRHCTQIYFLLKAGEVSALHRVKSDEVFHHYLGGPVRQLQLFEDGQARIEIIGGEIAAGQRPQVVVPAGVWQGAVLADGIDSALSEDFALMGCTVAPSFEWEDFELASDAIVEELTTRWPEHEGMINRLRPAR